MKLINKYVLNYSDSTSYCERYDSIASAKDVLDLTASFIKDGFSYSSFDIIPESSNEEYEAPIYGNSYEDLARRLKNWENALKIIEIELSGVYNGKKAVTTISPKSNTVIVRVSKQ